MSTARTEILARVRAALADVPPGEPGHWNGPGPAGAPDAYRRIAADGAPAPADLFADRVGDYRATVARCAGDDEAIALAVAGALRDHAAQRVVVPAGIPDAWLTATGVTWQVDEDDAPFPARALDAVDGVLTAAAVGIAETGTIALDHGPGQGRRALSLVPDLHVCVVRVAQIVATVPEGLEALAPAIAGGRPVTLVSGPSATSDIELERVEGVHGPRQLVVIVAGA